MSKFVSKNIYCPIRSYGEKCECNICHSIVGLEVYQEFYNEKGAIYFVEGICPICGCPNIVDMLHKKTIPVREDFKNIESLPNIISVLYKELSDAYSVKAYTCVAITARTLIAHIAKENGMEIGKTFQEYTNFLIEEFLPKKTNNCWVDSIRILGNQATHDLIITLENDAKKVMNFIIALLTMIYELPNSAPTNN